MSRTLPLSVGFLTGVSVFLWLAGSVLAARFGSGAILAAYGAVALGAASTAYVVVRRVERRLWPASGSADATAPTAGESDSERSGGVTVELAALDVEREVDRLKSGRSRPEDDE
jgi:type IV secretory pathway TrbL component